MKFFILVFYMVSSLSFSEYTVAIDQNYVISKKSDIVADLKEAYRRIGIDVQIDIVPGERAVRRSISGYYQGLDARAINPTNFKNLIPVMVPLYSSNHINAYSLRDLGPINSYQDLEKWVVVFPIGMQLNKKIIKIVPNLKTFIAPDFTVLFSALEHNRADIMIMSGQVIQTIFKESEYTRLIQLNKEPLETINVYHHIHTSYSDLVPQLEIVIQQMKLEGYF
ncbi:MAG: hypothetical protein HRU38_04890 [Saccharospirillaceae bacterium]|nr:transporter substrate-binding domain-containing protein [Pseudomonadales bacterium]NRB77993.1 hypothetical protein [Saccharospirillaceae bacterium]